MTPAGPCGPFRRAVQHQQDLGEDLLGDVDLHLLLTLVRALQELLQGEDRHLVTGSELN